MPRWMRNSVGVGADSDFVAGLRVMTMVLPTRRTDWMVALVRAAVISGSGVLKVWGLPLVQTERMQRPATRAWMPLAMVSTSGSSGMKIE